MNSISIDEIILHLLLVILFTFLIWSGLSFVLKNRIKAGFITTLGLVLFFFYGHIFILLDNLQKDVDLSHLFLLIPFFILFGLGSYYFIKTKKPLNKATMIVNVIGISLIMISLVSIVEGYMASNLFLNDSSVDAEENPILVTNVENHPDIYYIILDGYAGSKSLQINNNYDNSEFINFLTKKGFYIPAESLSNYKYTLESIPSILNMKYVNYLGEENGIGAEEKKILQELARDSAVLQKFESKGYTIFNIQGEWKPTGTQMKHVDYQYCGEDNFANSDFGMLLIRTTMFNPIHVDMLSGDVRDKKLCSFSELIKMVERNDKPKFVFAHIIIPHPPYVFGPNGEAINPKILTQTNPSESLNKKQYLGQLEFANKKMQDIIEKLTTTDTPPVIIIQSAHGRRVGDFTNDYEKYLKNYNILKAYLFPEKGMNLKFETTTSVNTFRILFNLYFDEQYELLEDKIYFSSRPNNWNGDTPYHFIDITDILIKK